MTGGRILHGGDYNPEQWLEYPEILEEDIRLMKQAKVNCVTLGVFSWAMLEPEEGRYDFGWLEQIVDRLGQEDIQVVLATPSGAMPHWLTQRYPEVMQVQEDGTCNLPGKRHNFCYTSPVMREKIQALDRKLSLTFGKKENVILWHISNELGGNFGDSTCHCPQCQEAFRGWLKARYQTLENLNHAWWGRFWSHVYTDWEQIHSPMPQGEYTMTALKLDWRRFVSEQMSDFCAGEIQAVRSASDLPVTTNFMDFFKGLDYRRLAREVDVISWDSYPWWHSSKDEVPVASAAAAGHSLMRTMKKQPFLLMESTPSSVNWRNNNPVKRPGMHMLSSMQAIAHGSDSVQYFQWRKSRGSFEKFHGAVVDHKNGSNTRTFRDVTAVGERLSHLTELLDHTVNQPKAALVFDWENWWALEDTTGPRQDLDYVKTILEHYRPFWEAGVDVDLIGMEDSLEGYRLVAAPLNYMYRKDYAEKVEKFVAGGGIYVTTYFSGLVNETDLCFLGEHPLEKVLGIVQEEVDAPGPEFENHFRYQGQTYALGGMREMIHAKEQTEVLAVYEEDYVKGMPVLTRNSYGKGQAFYLAAETELSFLQQFYKELLKQAGVENSLGTELPYGVTVSERKSCDGGDSLVFVMNFRNEPVCIEGIGTWQDAESKEKYEKELKLEAFGCRLLKRT